MPRALPSAPMLCHAIESVQFSVSYSSSAHWLSPRLWSPSFLLTVPLCFHLPRARKQRFRGFELFLFYEKQEVAGWDPWIHSSPWCSWLLLLVMWYVLCPEVMVWWQPWLLPRDWELRCWCPVYIDSVLCGLIIMLVSELTLYLWPKVVLVWYRSLLYTIFLIVVSVAVWGSAWSPVHVHILCY